jgi:hypothetical protein
MQRCVFVEHEPSGESVARATAVVVMDQFVNRDLVSRLRAQRPVIVIAWNGLFEIEKYRKDLQDIDVLYTGPELSLEIDASYRPMIRGDCTYTMWKQRYARKQQFSIRGSLRYRARWERARLMGHRWVSVALGAVGASRHPAAFRRTLQSGVLRDRLVWAGVCYIDATVGLSDEEKRAFDAGLAHVRQVPSADARMHAALAMVADWRSRSTVQNAHRIFYVVNTLLRWAVLSYLGETLPAQTWFFGKDNLGLGLELELYVHNLVPSERVAFLELGGTKTGDDLYPRALHLLAREFYVISLAADGSGGLADVLERLRAELTRDTDLFFERLEARRRRLYSSMPVGCSLSEAHRRVWRDFSLVD